jgi:hypothetical protein
LRSVNFRANTVRKVFINLCACAGGKVTRVFCERLLGKCR